jgi:hypothetical protein
MTTSERSTNPLLRAAAIIGRGFLLGLGFSIALGVVLVVGRQWTSQRTAEQTELQGRFGEQNPQKDIALSDVEEVKHDGVTAILGTATNHGNTAAHGIDIQANLFNHVKFVDKYSTYIKGSLEPDKSQYFKIFCGCKDTPPAEHDSYKLEVLGGY